LKAGGLETSEAQINAMRARSAPTMAKRGMAILT